MKSQFKLRDYQESKVNSMFLDLHNSLLKSEKKAITLKAPTGAGKTIMLIALIEEIFNTMQSVPFNIIWVSESPDLNEQSISKISKFSEDINLYEDAEIITKENFESFEENKIYFLNYGKITKSAKLSEDAPDRNRLSIWKQFKKLGESDRRILLIIDEAHKGTVSKKEKDSENKTVKKSQKDTIIKEIITKLSPTGIIGVSATPQDFTDTVVDLGYKDHEEHRISPKEVIDSGMVKSKVINKSEKNPQHKVSQALIQEAIKDYDNSFILWNGLKSEGIDLEPIMLIQVDNNMQHSNEMSTLIQYLLDSEYIGKSNIYNSFGEHQNINIKIKNEVLSIPYIKPNEINDNLNLRVVLFKEALGEGWDCPRAEILLSIRKVDSETKIAQTVGRILRNPLYDRPDLTDKYPQLKDVLLFTSNYNQEILEDIENEFGQKTVSIDVEDSNKEGQVKLKTSIKSFFEKLSCKGYCRKSLETDNLDSLISKIGEKSIEKYKGEDNAYIAILEKAQKEIEEKINKTDIKETLNRPIIKQEKKLNDKKKEKSELSSEFIRSEGDIDSEFNIVCKEYFYKELKDELNLNINELNFSNEVKKFLKEIEYKNGYRKEIVAKIIMLSLIHNSSLKTFVTNTVNQMLAEVSVETGENLENMKYEISRSEKIYLPLEVLKYNIDEIENIKTTNLKKGQFFVDTDISGYFVDESNYGVFDLDSSGEIDFIKHSVKNNTFKTLIRNDASSNGSKGLAIKYIKNNGKESLFCPDFLGIDCSDCFTIIEIKGLNDDDWKEKLKGLISFVKNLRKEGKQVKFNFILMINQGEYYKIDDVDILGVINGINENSIRTNSLTQIKKINL